MPVLSKSETLNTFYQHKMVRFFLSAGIATVADVLVYYTIINYVLKHQSIQFNHFRVSAHEFTLTISYSVGIIVNFLITKYTVFNESNLRARKQFIRFATIAFVGFFANYALLRFFVELCGFWPTAGRISSALSLGFASYYIHKLFTFKVRTHA